MYYIYIYIYRFEQVVKRAKHSQAVIVMVQNPRRLLSEVWKLPRLVMGLRDPHSIRWNSGPVYIRQLLEDRGLAPSRPVKISTTMSRPSCLVQISTLFQFRHIPSGGPAKGPENDAPMTPMPGPRATSSLCRSLSRWFSSEHQACSFSFIHCTASLLANS